ncbi:MAG TPA: hypothetical protein VFT54_03995 [Acidimicrobiia bacterium]|nr:hypothetical protein [Acidimicrobiia bacterium]
MTRRRWLPWAALTLAVVEIAVAWVLVGSVDAVAVAVTIYILSTGFAGAVVASRLPRHPVGWLLLAASFCFATGSLFLIYVDLTLFQRPGSIPPSHWFVLLGDIFFDIGLGVSSTFALLLFPTGRLPSRRWTPVAWASGIGLLGLVLSVPLSPDTFEGMPIYNPFALPSSHPLLLLVEGGGFYLFAACVIASVASLVVRFRRSTGTERQQLKWVAFSVVLLGIGLAGTILWELLNGAAEVSDNLENLIITISVSLLPMAIGIAIVRYRLFDIDRIVSRTVSYGVVVVVLGATFGALVFVLGDLLPLEGQLPVASTTLVVAALFNPLRRRVQERVDRRFNRSRYDAARTIELFTRRLRSSVDLVALGRDLQTVAAATMQPVSMSMWLRGRREP